MSVSTQNETNRIALIYFKMLIKIKNKLLNYNGAVGTQNLITREQWLEKTLKKIPAGHRILDAGAGELKYKKFCTHLDYISQDFGQYDGEGDQAGLQTKA